MNHHHSAHLMQHLNGGAWAMAAAPPGNGGSSAAGGVQQQNTAALQMLLHSHNLMQPFLQQQHHHHQQQGAGGGSGGGQQQPMLSAAHAQLQQQQQRGAAASSQPSQGHQEQRGPLPFTHYYMQRITTNAVHALFWAVDAAGDAKLAILGTDVRQTGHFVYATVSDWTAGPPLRCTNRARVMQYLSELGASNPAQEGQQPLRLPPLAPHHWQQLSSGDHGNQRPRLDRAYDSWREELGTLPDGRHTKKYFAVETSSGAQRLMVVAEDGVRRDRRYAYKAASSLGGFAFENGKAVSQWLDYVVGRTDEPPEFMRRDAPPDRSKRAKRLHDLPCGVQLMAPQPAAAVQQQQSGRMVAAGGIGGGSAHQQQNQQQQQQQLDLPWAAAGGSGAGSMAEQQLNANMQQWGAAWSGAGATAAAALAVASSAQAAAAAGAGGGTGATALQAPQHHQQQAAPMTDDWWWGPGNNGDYDLHLEEQGTMPALPGSGIGTVGGIGGSNSAAAVSGHAAELDAVFGSDPGLRRWVMAVPQEWEVAAFRRWAARLRPGAGGGGGGVDASGSNGMGAWEAEGPLGAEDVVRLLRELSAYPASLRLLEVSGIVPAVAALADSAPAATIRDAAAAVTAHWKRAAAAALVRCNTALAEGCGGGDAAVGSWWGLNGGGM